LSIEECFLLGERKFGFKPSFSLSCAKVADYAFEYKVADFLYFIYRDCGLI